MKKSKNLGVSELVEIKKEWKEPVLPYEKNLTTASVAKKISRLMASTPMELHDHLKDRSLPVIEQILTRTILETLSCDDLRDRLGALEWLMQRSIGKAPNTIKVHTSYFDMITEEEIRRLTEEAEKNPEVMAIYGESP